MERRRWNDKMTKRDSEWAAANNFVGLTMSRFKRGRLHSGGLKGSRYKVTNPKQAIAIALSMQERHSDPRRKVKTLPPSHFQSRKSGQDNCLNPQYWGNYRRLGGV